mmetsp:Transcript_22833/g.56846  ORF Transcript_22833/g.56846 Transcript_22833/m.56846 type:complete len:293 (-) Transcript_22833:376-1254(-)
MHDRFRVDVDQSFKRLPRHGPNESLAEPWMPLLASLGELPLQVAAVCHFEDEGELRVRLEPLKDPQHIRVVQLLHDVQLCVDLLVWRRDVLGDELAHVLVPRRLVLDPHAAPEAALPQELFLHVVVLQLVHVSSHELGPGHLEPRVLVPDAPQDLGQDRLESREGDAGRHDAAVPMRRFFPQHGPEQRKETLRNSPIRQDLWQRRSWQRIGHVSSLRGGLLQEVEDLAAGALVGGLAGEGGGDGLHQLRPVFRRRRRHHLTAAVVDQKLHPAHPAHGAGHHVPLSVALQQLS